MKLIGNVYNLTLGLSQLMYYHFAHNLKEFVYYSFIYFIVAAFVVVEYTIV